MANPWTEYMEEMGLEDGGGVSALAPEAGSAFDIDTSVYSPSLQPGGVSPGAYAPILPSGVPRVAAGAAPVPTETPKGGAQVSAAQQGARTKHASAKGSVADYIRQAATARGIDPNVALAIAAAEGGYDDNDVAREGSFNTGKSYWAYQLHYGGKGTPYESYGNTAGMGNDFTAKTGYKPGDPNAWQASIDWALDHARKYGWGAWYGRGPAGIGEWDGIPR